MCLFHYLTPLEFCMFIHNSLKWPILITPFHIPAVTTPVYSFQILLACCFPLLDTLKSALCTKQFSQIDLALLINLAVLFKYILRVRKKNFFFNFSWQRVKSCLSSVFSMAFIANNKTSVRQKSHRPGKDFMTSGYGGRKLLYEEESICL